MARRGDRFTTGEVCGAPGAYVFDGYLDGTDTPAPIASELVVPLEAGTPFPPVDGGGRAAWWRLQRR